MNYRYAEQIFESVQLQRTKYEILDIVDRAPALRRASDSKSEFDYDPDAMNAWFDEEFKARKWEYHPYVIPDRSTGLQADFKKGPVQVEIQFGNIARAIYDLFKMQVSYSQNAIDVGVLILPVQALAKQVGDNVANFERIRRELPYAKLSITLPIWVIGLSHGPLPSSGPEPTPKPTIEIPAALRRAVAKQVTLEESPKGASAPSLRSRRRSRRP